jgi:hypothetical protein
MKKIALIIGNSTYPGNTLVNPVNDAVAIEKQFRLLGIDTFQYSNLSQIQFEDALKDFDNRLDNYEVGIFFFAGHGMQIDGENYLCAVDTNFHDENFAKHTSIPLNLILDMVKKSKLYTKIFILDACRTNPYERNFRSGYQKGLAPIYAPIGTIIAFATSPGETASDGNGKNGAFTYALLQHIGQQDLKIEELFKRTRNTLYAITSSKQLSWEHTSLMGDFYFSTSQLTGSYTSNYDKTAMADESFDLSSDSPIISIIRKLKSYNWYTQNPAFSLIRPELLATADINEIFVLGRNIYQAACGSSGGAIDFLRNLKINLSRFNDEIRYHLMNGIVFEIYFDSMGKLRDIFKFDFIDNTIPLLKNDTFITSAIFLKSKLDEYDFRVLYDVTGRNNIMFNLILEPYNSKVYRVKEIQKESKNVFFDSHGKNEYKINDLEKTLDRERIQLEIAQKIGAPISHVICIFTGIPDNIQQIKFPFPEAYKLLNYRLSV